MAATELPDAEELAEIGRELGLVIAYAKDAGYMQFDEQAWGLWDAVYPELSRDRYGLSGSLCGRAEAHVLRLSLIYAILGKSRSIQPEHLAAALAVWKYAEQSVSCIFGNATGNPLADELLRLIVAAGSTGLSRTEMSNLLGRNQPANKIGQALGVLLQAGLAHPEQRTTGGRPAEVWVATGAGGSPRA